MSADALLEQYRPALTGHCYRMLGSVVDAEDAVQEAMLRAWKGLDRFGEQSSLKTWLYRIATNVCLDTLSATNRQRTRPLDASEAPGIVRDDMMLTQRSREQWVEPIPDAMALPAGDDVNPEERALLRESIRLAFVAALQYLPPRQRAALLLTQVLNFSAAETAETLEMSVAAVNSALQRARSTLDARNPAVVPRELSVEQQRLVARYVDAFAPRAGGGVRGHAGLGAVSRRRRDAMGAADDRDRGRQDRQHDLVPGCRDALSTLRSPAAARGLIRLRPPRSVPAKELSSGPMIFRARGSPTP
jgi:RNA polymerase sigma-70 factor (TIGR02960 family)